MVEIINIKLLLICIILVLISFIFRDYILRYTQTDTSKLFKNTKPIKLYDTQPCVVDRQELLEYLRNDVCLHQFKDTTNHQKNDNKIINPINLIEKNV